MIFYNFNSYLFKKKKKKKFKLQLPITTNLVLHHYSAKHTFS